MEQNREEQKSTKEENAPKKRNWVTDLYDRANVSVHQLNIALVFLCALIVVLFFVFGK